MTVKYVPSPASCMITKVQLTASTSPKWRSTVRPKADLHLRLVPSPLQAPSVQVQLHHLQLHHSTSPVQPRRSSIRTQLLQVQSARGRVAGGLRVKKQSYRSLLLSSLRWLNQILMLPRCLVLYHVYISERMYTS